MSQRIPVNLYKDASLTVAKTEVISAEASTKRIIRKATFANTTAAALTIDIYIDPDGTEEVHIRTARTLAPYETWSCPDLEGEVLEAGGTLDLTPSGAGIACSIPGIKVT